MNPSDYSKAMWSINKKYAAAIVAAEKKKNAAIRDLKIVSKMMNKLQQDEELAAMKAGINGVEKAGK